MVLFKVYFLLKNVYSFDQNFWSKSYIFGWEMVIFLVKNGYIFSPKINIFVWKYYIYGWKYYIFGWKYYIFGWKSFIISWKMVIFLAKKYYIFGRKSYIFGQKKFHFWSKKVTFLVKKVTFLVKKSYIFVKKSFILVENGYIFDWLYFWSVIFFVSYIYRCYIFGGYIISLIFSPPIKISNIKNTIFLYPKI